VTRCNCYVCSGEPIPPPAMAKIAKALDTPLVGPATREFVQTLALAEKMAPPERPQNVVQRPDWSDAQGGREA